jgi:hypothetical protein
VISHGGCTLNINRPNHLDAIKCGYAVDEYCLKISKSSMPGTRCVNGLWYISDRLLIPHDGNIHENLFCLAYNALGHFGADKSFVMHTTGRTYNVIWKRPIFLIYICVRSLWQLTEMSNVNSEMYIHRCSHFVPSCILARSQPN